MTSSGNVSDEEREQRLAEWRKDLLSGEYKPGKHVLRGSPDGDGVRRYCCLGVACETYKRLTGQGAWVGGVFNASEEDFSPVSLPEAVCEFFGVTTDATLRRSVTINLGGHMVAKTNLIGLNDNDLPFEEIARHVYADALLDPTRPDNDKPADS